MVFFLVYAIKTYLSYNLQGSFPVACHSWHLPWPSRVGCSLSCMLPQFSGYSWNLTHRFKPVRFQFGFMFILHLHVIAFPQSLVQYLVFMCPHRKAQFSGWSQIDSMFYSSETQPQQLLIQILCTLSKSVILRL